MDMRLRGWLDQLASEKFWFVRERHAVAARMAVQRIECLEAAYDSKAQEAKGLYLQLTEQSGRLEEMEALAAQRDRLLDELSDSERRHAEWEREKVQLSEDVEHLQASAQEKQRVIESLRGELADDKVIVEDLTQRTKAMGDCLRAVSQVVEGHLTS